MKKGQKLRRAGPPPLPVHAAQADGEIPFHRQVGEQGVMLEEEAHPARLRRKVHPRPAVEEDLAVQLNPAPVRPVDAGDAF